MSIDEGKLLGVFSRMIEVAKGDEEVMLKESKLRFLMASLSNDELLFLLDVLDGKRVI